MKSIAVFCCLWWKTATMSQRSAQTTNFIFIFTLLICTALARHAHRRPLHRHAARATSLPTNYLTASTASHVTSTDADSVMTAYTTADALFSSLTAGDAVIEDILSIQTGLSELPEDLLAFILALEQRLAEVEKMLSGYTQGSAPSIGPVGPVMSPIPPEPTRDIPGEPSGDAGVSEPVFSSSAAVTTTRSTRITQTMTIIQTITPAVPMYTGIRSNDSFPAMNGTDFTPPAPWTKPYIVTLASSAQSISGLPSSEEPSASSLATTLIPSTETAASTVTPSPYVFDRQSQSNVAVYYGTTPATTTDGLLSLCSNSNVDIVILSFVFSFFDANGYPSIDFGPGCSGQTSAQIITAPGLKDCSALAPEITACQSLGKKVLLSLGGYNSNTSFTSDVQARDFASTLWSLFGPGEDLDPGLRPFGGTDVVIDGFDIDNENHSTDYYVTFATALRENFDTDNSKTYYLSAAPQCPIPDESIPLGALQQADFVWVQFYNNPSCNLDSPSFEQSFKDWSALLANGAPEGRGPRLYVGAAGFEGAGSGYVNGPGLFHGIANVTSLHLDNFGGVMLWDGSEAVLNVDQTGFTYLDYAKGALDCDEELQTRRSCMA